MSLQVETLERSFEQIKPVADDFVGSFYSNLFTDYPAAEPLFSGASMEEQKPKLLKSLVLVIQNLRNPDVLGGALKGLGARHVQYGALPEHYPLVGNSLLKTFEQYLGTDWTPEVKQAWVDAYGAISEIMLEGADYSAEALELENAVPAGVEAGVTSTRDTTADLEAVSETGEERSIRLLETSFAQVTPDANAFASSFYTNLFTDYPAAKPLFSNTHMKKQEQMLLQSLILVVENLRNPDVLSQTLKGLGARHVKYGALPEHYPLVGNSLLKTFEQYLASDWTPDVKQAWIDAYGTISEIMLDGADYSPTEVELNSSDTEQSVETELTTTPAHIEPVVMAESNPELQSQDKSAIKQNPESGEKGLLAIIAGGVIAVIVIALLL